jgi:GGDEF domain-containing protein
MLPGQSAKMTIQNSRDKLDNNTFKAFNDARGHAVGVAGFPEHGDNGADIVRMADAMLYQAKRAGRDPVLAAVSAI